MNFFSYYVHVVHKRTSQVGSIVIWFVFFYFFWKLGDPFPMLSPKHGKHVTNVWAHSQSHYKFMDPFPILSSKHVKHVTNVWAYSQSHYKFMDPVPILCLACQILFCPDVSAGYFKKHYSSTIHVLVLFSMTIMATFSYSYSISSFSKF